jgi:hypothetical protein
VRFTGERLSYIFYIIQTNCPGKVHFSSSTEVVVGSRTIFNVNQEFWQDSWYAKAPWVATLHKSAKSEYYHSRTLGLIESKKQTLEDLRSMI